jgi:hypothetical protein
MAFPLMRLNASAPARPPVLDDQSINILKLLFNERTIVYKIDEEDIKKNKDRIIEELINLNRQKSKVFLFENSSIKSIEETKDDKRMRLIFEQPRLSPLIDKNKFLQRIYFFNNYILYLTNTDADLVFGEKPKIIKSFQDILKETIITMGPPKGTRPLPKKKTRPLLRDSSFYKDANLSQVTDIKYFNDLIIQLFKDIDRNKIKTIEEIDDFFKKNSSIFDQMTFVNKKNIIESNKKTARKKFIIQQKKQRHQTHQTHQTHETQGGNKIKKITRKVYLDDKGKSYIKYDNIKIYLKMY